MFIHFPSIVEDNDLKIFPRTSSGWWYTYPSEKVRQLGWWHSQDDGKNKSHISSFTWNPLKPMDSSYKNLRHFRMGSHPLGAPADVTVPQALHRDAFSRVPHLNLRDLWVFFQYQWMGWWLKNHQPKNDGVKVNGKASWEGWHPIYDNQNGLV